MATVVSSWSRNDPRLEFREADHSYWLGEKSLVSVTQVLALAGLADFSGVWFSEAIKARGAALHLAVGLDVEEALDEDSLDDEIRGGVDGWRAFLADTGAEVEHWEQRVCDPAQGVAGRLDGIVRLRDPRTGRTRRILIDLKRGLYDCAAIQLAAYVDMAAAFYDSPVYLERAALVLPCDGTYAFHAFTDTTDRATWQSALRVVTWRKSHGLN